ncbi:MAG: HYR domain-containing protein, partial [Bacteroidota bacterium]
LPVARCQNRLISLNGSGTATLAISQLNNNSTDNCQSGLVLSPASFSYTCADLGDNIETLVATDAQGNTSTCTATVTVQDNMAPSANCQNLTVSLSSGGTATVTGAELSSNSTDNCQGTLAIDPVSINYNCSSIGMQTVTLTVTDLNGNTASCTSVVTVQDVTLPAAVCKNITLQLNAQGLATGVPADLNNGSSDNCTAGSSLVLTTSEQLSYTCTQIGSRTVTLTVGDASGNTASCTSTVTISDNTPPVISQCPPGVTVNDCNALVTDLTSGLTATDNCTNIASIIQVPPAGSGLNLLGTGNTITFTVTDQSGN